IRHSIAAGLDHHVVAAVLAFDSNLPRAPPDRRMVEEKRFDERLQHVDEVIMPAHMSELVGENGSEVRRSQTGNHTRRKQDDRSQATDDGRHADESGFEDTYGPVD